MASKKNTKLIISQDDIEDIYDAKNKLNNVVLEGIKYDDITSIEVNGDDDLLVINTEDREIKIDRYSKIRYITTQEDLLFQKTTDIIAAAIVNNNETITEEDRKKFKLSGTSYNDTINAIDFDVAQKGKYKDKGLTISAGAGNDEITGTMGNDTITGGAGINTLVVSGDFGKDTVSLTKGETLIIDLSDYGFTKIDDIDFDASNKKDLKLTIKDDMGTGGTLTIKNYTKKNLAGTKVLVKLDADQEIEDMKDLSTLDIYDYGKDNFSKGVFKGTRFSETIDARGFSKALGKKNKGVTIDGGAGYNKIYGTDGFNDTIKGGNDGNEITAGEGNKTITTGSGADKITIYGDGTHTIKAGAGENDIQIYGDGKTTITTGNDKDIIYVANDLGKTTISAGAGENNITITGDSSATIKSGKDNDTINISGYSTSTIYAGGGENTINIESNVYGHITLAEEKVNAINTICFKSGLNSDYFMTKEGNDLLICWGNSPFEYVDPDNAEGYKGDPSSLRLKDYYVNKAKYAQYKFKIGNEEKTFDDLVAIIGGVIIPANKGTIKGTSDNDIITIATNGSVSEKHVKVFAGAGNDIIYNFGHGLAEITGGKGNDIIECLDKETIYFNEGDGHDIVNNAWITTLVFPKGNLRFLNTNEGMLAFYGKGNDYVNFGGTSPTLRAQVGNKNRQLSSFIKSSELRMEGVNPVTDYSGPHPRTVYSEVNYYGTNGPDTITEFSNGNSTVYTLGGNDLISVNGSNNKIYCGAGNDIMYTASSNTLYGGEGNDTYMIGTNYNTWNTSKRTITIYDESGDNDVLTLKKTDNIIVNIHNDKTYEDMLQLSYDNKIISIDKYFSEGKIEKIIGQSEVKTTTGWSSYYVEDCYLDMSNFDSVVEEVAGWLADKGYTDVNTAIEADAGNLTTLSGAQYFGALEWKPL